MRRAASAAPSACCSSAASTQSPAPWACSRPPHEGLKAQSPDCLLADPGDVQVAYRLDHLPSQQEVFAIPDRPYRRLATRYLFSAAFAASAASRAGGS
jgi:hypothetical protein